MKHVLRTIPWFTLFLLTACPGGVQQSFSSLSPAANSTASLVVAPSVPLVTLVSIAVAPASASIVLGESQTFTATGTFSDGTTQDLTNSAVWSSSVLATATLNANTAISVAQGSTLISAADGSISGSSTVTVTPPLLVGIAVTPSSASIALGNKQAFIATGTYTDGSTQNVTSSAIWTSTNTATASLNAAAIASSLAQGSTGIGAAIGPISGSAMLTVTPPTLVSIAVTPSAASVALGNKQSFIATGIYTDGSTQNLTSAAVWTATNPAASVSAGVATSVSQGNTVIEATVGQVVGNANLAVTPPVLVSLVISPASGGLAPGGTEQFSAVGTYTDNSTHTVTNAVAWASSNLAVATIAGGLATGISGGNTLITASEGTVTSNSASVNVIAISVANLHNNSWVQTGFMVGSVDGASAVGVQLDGGTVQSVATAAGTSSWRFALPTGAGGWRLGSKHTISVGPIDASGNLIESLVSELTVFKGVNQDFNGDGYPDLIVGDSTWNNFTGRAYVFLSRGAKGLNGNSLSAANADYVLTGLSSVQGEFGVSVATGDFNASGYAGIAVGADSYIDCMRCTTGKVFVFYSQGQSAFGLSSAISANSAKTIITGEGSQSIFGVVLTTGDVNGDGADDLIVADVNANSGYGRAYLYLGGNKGLGSGSANVAAVSGAQAIFNGSGGWFGASVAIGDVNADGFADIAIGAPWAGKVYLYVSPGSAGYASTIATTQATSTVSGSSADVSNWFGEIIALGDITGKGLASLFVSAPGPEEITVSNGQWIYLNKGIGRVYVFTPAASGFPAAVASSAANSVLIGENGGDDFGVSIAIGDANGDGFQDVAIGANTYKSCSALNQYAEDANCQGRAYLFQSSAKGLAGASIGAARASTVLQAGNDPGNFGVAVVFCDINGDGNQDLIVTGNGADQNGRLYLFDGATPGLGTIVQNTAATSIISGEAEAGQTTNTLGDSAD